MYSFFDKLARLFALLGGLVLPVLVVLTCLSVLGRSLNAFGLGPINGDFELVEAGMAFAIFAFLPLCQLDGAHASVDIFTARLPARTGRALRALTEIVFAVVLVVIAWQLYRGMASKMRSGQTTFLLEFPVWWAYALSLSGAVVAALVATYVALIRTREALIDRDILPPGEEADH